MRSYQLDTNALLRYITNDIRVQADQVELLFKKAIKGSVSLHICEPVFIETAVMLRNYFKFPKNKIVEALTPLLNSPELEIENRHQLTLAISIYSNKDLDLVDCILLIRAQNRKQQIFTFDSKLQTLFSS